MYRVLISGLVALGFVSSLAVTADARGGFGGGGLARGPAIGRPAIAPGGFRGVAPRPVAPLGLTRRPLLAAVPILALHRTPLPRFRRVFGRDLPGNGVGVYYGSGGLGLSDAAAYPAPSLGPIVTSSGEDVASLPRRGCGTQTVIVPAEAGGEARIRMTYC